MSALRPVPGVLSGGRRPDRHGSVRCRTGAGRRRHGRGDGKPGGTAKIRLVTEVHGNGRPPG
jgi:hypothetical protein